MKQVNILAIGNSFSEDATHYLHQIAACGGIENKVVNLYIGGCPLEKHWLNLESEEAAYQYQLNGCKTDRFASIQEVLAEEPWDFIVTQQASHDSGWQDTYEPFLGLLLEEIHKQAPTAEVLLQQTWAYETDSPHANFMRYRRDQREMYRRSKAAYEAAAQRHGLRLIPCGDVIQHLRQEGAFCYEKGGLSLCRDGFHMHYLYGRYLLAAVWVKTLFGLSLAQNIFVPSTPLAPDMAVEPELFAYLKEEIDSFFQKRQL